MGLPGPECGERPAGQRGVEGGGSACGGAGRVAEQAGEAGGADPLVVLVRDDDLVRGGGASAVHGGGDARDEAAADAPVVGAVEVDADGDLGGAAVQHAPDGAEGLGEDGGG